MSLSSHRLWARLLALPFTAALLCSALLLLSPPGHAAGDIGKHLASAAWLQQNLARAELLLIDASPTPMFAAQHIPGAVHADLMSFGGRELSPPQMQRRLQAWGISPGKKLVLYDQDGQMWAARLFFDLYQLGFPAADMLLLDGGLTAWKAAGGALTKEPTPAPAAGTFRITRSRDEVVARLPEFLAATGDPQQHAVVEALEPEYYYGGTKFFDRGGHVPNAVMLPRSDFFDANQRFKSPAQIQRLLNHLGITPERQITSYCGGGVAAAVPFFAMKFMLGYPEVKLFRGSQIEWLRDGRGLPMWTYSAPELQRNAAWLQGWFTPTMRAMGVARLNVLDVRPAAAFALGHVPGAVNLPAATLTGQLRRPEQLAKTLRSLGVNPAQETVIVSGRGGIDPEAALALLMLQRLGHSRVSLLAESVDEWALQGLPVHQSPMNTGPVAGAAPVDSALVNPAPVDMVLGNSTPLNDARPGLLIDDPTRTRGHFPKVYIASGAALTQRAPVDAAKGSVIHLPYTELLKSDGTPKAANEIWDRLIKAGVPRYAEIVLYADEPGDAAANYVLLRLMGFTDLKVWAL